MRLDRMSKKQKIFLIVMSVALSLFAVSGFSLAFFMNYNTFAPQTPIILDDGENVFITTSQNDNYDKYRFVFERDETKIVIDSKSNALSMEQILANDVRVGSTYQVSACYVGEDDINSEYSKPLSWLCQTYLSAPEIQIQDNKIVWDDIIGAEEYRIYVKQGEKLYLDTTSACEYEYSHLAGGQTEVYVVAHSSRLGYKDSRQSGTASFNHIYKLKEFERATFDKSSKVITLTAKEEVKLVRVICNGVSHIVKPVRISDDEFVYTISLKTIYQVGYSVGIAPFAEDEYSTFDGDILYL